MDLRTGKRLDPPAGNEPEASTPRETPKTRLWAKMVAATFGALLLVGLCERFVEVPETELLVPSASARDNSALKERLAYLRNIDEVAWVEFEDNNVYIGFARRPPDLVGIVNAAAFLGNRALGFGVHVWAAPAEPHGWRPGDGPYYCEATARYGKLKDPCN